MDLLPVDLGALLTGGFVTAWVGWKKAPVERDALRVNQADQVADGALALLEQERERFREQLDPLTQELARLREDRAHDRERCRQLTVANEALRDELAAKDHELEQLRRAQRDDRAVADLRRTQREEPQV